MKALILIALLSSTVEAKEFKFAYTLKKEKIEYKVDAITWEDAYVQGAVYCFEFFTKNDKRISEEKGLDIIDACANPR